MSVRVSAKVRVSSVSVISVSCPVSVSGGSRICKRGPRSRIEAPNGRAVKVGVVKVGSSVVKIKKVVGDDTKASKAPQWGSPDPAILALLFIIMTTGVRHDRGDLLQAAYSQPQVHRHLCF